ncbi:hypothetical protein CDV55_101802 [Aspergillus turcosus]|uniref:Uncharacterized protein n=1 Tax=Aspergillus turcosus TaxID=1245748 RepID=A0A229XNP3_9EURO|nr:hypothetical protein CDV55_101802 [Aspergillus turcosus]RLM00126.1 hypothetical protein CFD26_108451 [Aspergillus turcosus]
MWSFDAVLFHILSGTPPYTEEAERGGFDLVTYVLRHDNPWTRVRMNKLRGRIFFTLMVTWPTATTVTQL